MAAVNVEGLSTYAHGNTHSISQEDAVQMVRGIQLYQNSKYKRTAMPLEKIWEQDRARLYRPSNSNANGTPLILVPSLINKSYIFDLTSDCSMLRWFHKKGKNAYLFDWGDLKEEETIESLIKNKLHPACAYLASQSHEKIDALGYCMGGTILLGHHELLKAHIGRMVLMAAPWDFKAQGANLARNVRIWSPTVLPVIKKQGKLPKEWVQALFASLDAKASAKKFINFASIDKRSKKAQLFIHVEDWLNDGVDIPCNIAQHCIQQWFLNNALCKQKKTPLDSAFLIVASHKDKIVPLSCALAAQKNINSQLLTIIEGHMGHIGMIAGKNAQEKIWQPILGWLNKI